ncbi:hypothetical protein MMPV_001655 [Pyropia vietnamensis]
MTTSVRAAFAGVAAARPCLDPGHHPLISVVVASRRGLPPALNGAGGTSPPRLSYRTAPVASGAGRRARRESAAALAAAKAAAARPPLTGVGMPSPSAPPSVLAEAPTTATTVGADGDDDDTLAEVASFVIDDDEAGQRLDKILAARFPGQSRSYYQSLLAGGHVSLTEASSSAGGAATSVVPRKATKVRAGDAVRVVLVATAADLPLVPEDLPLDILYEDEHVVAVNKPAGLVVHPAPGNWTGTLVHALAFRYKGLLAMADTAPLPSGGNTDGCGETDVDAGDDFGEWTSMHAASLAAKRPGLVHRLDKGTSGVMIAALTPEAHRGLVSAFSGRRVHKQYVAITAGSAAGAGCVSAELTDPIGRHPTERTKMAVVSVADGGRPAHTLVENLASDDGGVLHVARVTIATGRTHQIRVHTAAMRAPVLGDGLYGSAEVNYRFRTAAPRPMLHASALDVDHPVTGARLELRAPLPADMAHLLRSRIYPTFEAEQPEWAVGGGTPNPAASATAAAAAAAATGTTNATTDTTASNSGKP